MILLHFHWHSLLGYFVMLSLFSGHFVMFSLHLADKVGISSPMCSWPEIEKSNLKLGQIITKYECAKRKGLVEDFTGWLVVRPS